jgi:diketogulonate reductase-like aldo/keto reductase
MPDVSTLTLNNGVELPALGLGVFQTPADETRAAVEAALSAGYRHIDTAAAYGNERQVGEAVRNSGLDRSEVFLETKIWISDYGYDKTLHGFEKSARKLGVDQIDLLILHQALPSDFEATLEAYRGLESLLGDGKVRAIGVSNFMVEHLTTLLDRATMVPAVNQIEIHPYFQQHDVQALNAERGILTQAWSPIGGITFYRDRAAQQHPEGPGDRRHRHGSRQDSRTGHAALASAAGPLGNPEVDQARADRREHRRFRLRPVQRGARGHRRPRHWPAGRPRA